MAFTNIAQNSEYKISFIDNLADLSVEQKTKVCRYIVEAREALAMVDQLVNQARAENALAAAEAARKAAAEKSAADKSELCERVNKALIALNILAEESDYIGLHMVGMHAEANEILIKGDLEYRFGLLVNSQDWKVLDLIFQHGAGFVPSEINGWNESSIRNFVEEFEKIFK